MKESKFFEEVMHEGAVAQARKDVLQVLEIRFKPAAVTRFREPLAAIADLDRLEELFRLAMQCRRLADFQRALPVAGSEE